mmetsp:Transcript_56552/g.109152  ORF Transcript_56552/g.109152 Transcript_56552/m.109152 type:complete len:204 (+) Transcript_56552:210-821(+)
MTQSTAGSEASAVSSSSSASPPASPSSMRTVPIPIAFAARQFLMESSNMTAFAAVEPTESRTLLNAATSGLQAGRTSSTAKMRSSEKKGRSFRTSQHFITYLRVELENNIILNPAAENSPRTFRNSSLGLMYVSNWRFSAQYLSRSSLSKCFPSGSLPSCSATMRPLLEEWYFLKYSVRNFSAASSDAKPKFATINLGTASFR